MAHRITLPGAGTRVLGGLQFTDDVAEGEIGPNLHRYFSDRGAEIVSVETRTTTRKRLKALTPDQLAAHAAAYDVKLPADTPASKIIDAILDVEFPKA